MADEVDQASDSIEHGLGITIENRVRYEGVSAFECEECGAEIPEGRRLAIAGTRHCAGCAEVIERRNSGIARR